MQSSKTFSLEVEKIAKEKKFKISGISNKNSKSFATEKTLAIDPEKTRDINLRFTCFEKSLNFRFKNNFNAL